LVTSDQQQAILKRAFGYPYPLTHQSFIFHAGEQVTHRLIDDPSAFPDVFGRTPVLAVGSNQSPEQLARKFPSADWGEIPTSRVHLQDFDTVYSAHVTGYGSIAATLHPAPGTGVSLYVNWLDQRQLLAMHETELSNQNYTYAALENINLSFEAGPTLTTVNLYIGSRGAYAPEGQAIPLAEVPAEGRAIGLAKSQAEILAHVHAKLAPEMELDQFIFSSIEDTDKRRAYIDKLERTSHKFESIQISKLDVPQLSMQTKSIRNRDLI
jgi:hypothetical protein